MYENDFFCVAGTLSVEFFDNVCGRTGHVFSYVAAQKESAINTKCTIHLFPYFLRNDAFTKNYLTLSSGADCVF